MGEAAEQVVVQDTDTSNNPPALELRDVSFVKNGQALLDRLTVTLRPEPLSVVLGPNGAGKSLLLRLCHGLLTPTHGTVGHGHGTDRPIRQAMVFQRPVMLRRSVAANIRYALSVSGVPRHERAGLVAAALARAGLEPLAERSARVLSGGEQQRLALARAWVLQPSLLFLDEPTANLDPAASSFVETLIRMFHAEGTKIVLTTHDLGQARRLADDVVFLHKGRLVEHTWADSFFEAPENNEARAFVRGEIVP